MPPGETRNLCGLLQIFQKTIRANPPDSRAARPLYFTIFRAKNFDMLTIDEPQTLFDLQASVSGQRGILPALPASRMESGKLGQSGLSAGDDFAARRYAPVLAFSVFGVSLSLEFSLPPASGLTRVSAILSIMRALSALRVTLLLIMAKAKISSAPCA